jgi:hypothetical protein
MALEEKLMLEVYFQIEELNAEIARLRSQLATAKKALKYIGYSKGVSSVDFSWKKEWQHLIEVGRDALKELEADE